MFVQPNHFLAFFCSSFLWSARTMAFRSERTLSANWRWVIVFSKWESFGSFCTVSATVFIEIVFVERISLENVWLNKWSSSIVRSDCDVFLEVCTDGAYSSSSPPFSSVLFALSIIHGVILINWCYFFNTILDNPGKGCLHDGLNLKPVFYIYTQNFRFVNWPFHLI